MNISYPCHKKEAKNKWLYKPFYASLWFLQTVKDALQMKEIWKNSKQYLFKYMLICFTVFSENEYLH